MKRSSLAILTCLSIVIVGTGMDCPGGGVWQPLMDMFYAKPEPPRFDDDQPVVGDVALVDDHTLWFNDGYVYDGDPSGVWIWGVQISQQKINPTTDEVVETTPVAGVMVTVRVEQGVMSQTMTGETGTDGYAAFAIPPSETFTELFLVNVQGPNPWNPIDAQAHLTIPILTSDDLGE